MTIMTTRRWICMFAASSGVVYTQALGPLRGQLSTSAEVPPSADIRIRGRLGIPQQPLLQVVGIEIQ